MKSHKLTINDFFEYVISNNTTIVHNSKYFDINKPIKYKYLIINDLLFGFYLNKNVVFIDKTKNEI